MSAVNVTQVAVLVRSLSALGVMLRKAFAPHSLLFISITRLLRSNRRVYQQDNPSRFINPMQFEIQYECLNDLQEGAIPTQCGSVSSLSPQTPTQDRLPAWVIMILMF